MVFFPATPLPSSVSAPAIIDPTLRYQVDQGYEVRRARTSRPRRRYQIDYLGKTTDEMHQIRDFILSMRLGVFPFQWLHPTAVDLVNMSANLTPVLIYYYTYHGLVTGQWVGVFGGPANANGLWQVTRLSNSTLTLNGSVGAGPAVINQANVFVYLPNAVAIFDQDTWTSPTKLIGPEQTNNLAGVFRAGVFSWTLLIEEIF